LLLAEISCKGISCSWKVDGSWRPQLVSQCYRNRRNWHCIRHAELRWGGAVTLWGGAVGSCT